MSAGKLEQRVAVLEDQVARLKDKLRSGAGTAQPWWQRITGSFSNDPMFDEAMRLGRAYRASQRPMKKNSRKRRNGSIGH